MRDVPDSESRGRSGFAKIADSFLSQPGLPFARVLSAERIERIFSKHDNLFGVGVGEIYSTSVVLWAFLGQVLRDGKEASCQAAVARISAYQEQQGAPVPTSDTGDYCKARPKLSEAGLRDLNREVAAELEDRADPAWLWKKRHPKLIDGFTFTMPDTKANQAEYPQHSAQKPGIGLPIARAVAVTSLATACVMDLAIGPYSGKETGETALLRSMLDTLSPGDIAVMDRYYCSYMMIALLLARGIDTCARKHHLRHTDFRRENVSVRTITSSSGFVRRVQRGWTKKPTRRSPNRCCSARFVTPSWKQTERPCVPTRTEVAPTFRCEVR